MSDFLKQLETVEAGISVKLNTMNKYNIVVNGSRTTVTLEPFTWEIFHQVAKRQETDVNKLCDFINERKGEGSSLASAIRVFLISYLYTKLENSGL